MFGTWQFFLVSLLLFILCASLFAYETKRGKRVFLAGLRNYIDTLLVRVTAWLSRRLTYLGRHIIKLSWYYSIHKVLRFILASLVRAYDFLEAAFMRNRDRARTLKIEKKTLFAPKGHFGQVADHKASTALTETQKKKLLQKKLERG
jgi:hypothetical protein